MSHKYKPQRDMEMQKLHGKQEELEGQEESDSAALISGKDNLSKLGAGKSSDTSSKDDKRLMAYFALVFIQGMHVLTFKISQMNGKYKYNTASAIAITEMVKFFMSMGLHAMERRESRESRQHPFFPRASMKQILSWTMLAICYCVNNQITFAILQYIGPGQLSVGKSFAPMLTAMMLWILYNTQINRLQWAAISLSVTGLITNQVCVPDDTESSSSSNDSRYALALLFISCMITAVSSVFNAKFLQKGDLPLQVNQMLLYSQGFVFNILAYMLGLGPSGKDIGFFEGYDNLGVILVLLSQSLIGLAISWVYLHGGAIVKTLAASTQAAILTVMDSLFFNIALGIGNTAGAVTVIISSYVYFTFALKWEEPQSQKKDILAGDVARRGCSVELVCKNILGILTAGTTMLCLFVVLFSVPVDEKTIVAATAKSTLSSNSTESVLAKIEPLVPLHAKNDKKPKATSNFSADDTNVPPSESSSTNDARALYEKKFDDLWMPNVKNAATNFGKYNKCAKENKDEIVLFLVWGHLRTFAMKLPNWHSFINAAPCRFVVVYTRDEMEAPGKAWWGDRQKQAGKHMLEDPKKILEEYVANHDNTAYQVVTLFGIKREDRLVGATQLAQAVIEYHGLPASTNTICVQTRTDFLFSHTINFKALRNGGMSRVKTKNWVFMPRHGLYTAGNDPQEGLLVGNFGWFTSKFSFEAFKEAIGPGQCGKCVWMPKNESVPEIAEALHACEARNKKAGTLRHYFRRFQIFDSICNDATPLFMNPDIKMHFYRLNGDYSIAIHSPGKMSWVNPKKPIGHGPLDLREKATEIFFPAISASCFCGDRSVDPNAHQAEIDAYNTKGEGFPISHGVSFGLTLKEKPF